MDERIDLSMSDPDLVPLLIQVYIFGFLCGCFVNGNNFLLPLTLVISKTCIPT